MWVVKPILLPSPDLCAPGLVHYTHGTSGNFWPLLLALGTLITQRGGKCWVYHCGCTCVCLGMCVHCVPLCVGLSASVYSMHVCICVSFWPCLSNICYQYPFQITFWEFTTRCMFLFSTGHHEASSSLPECQGTFSHADPRADLGGGPGLYRE